LEEHPHVVVDETLHKREIRRALYAEAERLAGGFIVIWVQAREDLILQRLGASKRDGHVLDDPLPLHHAFRREFEEYERCVVDCPNNASADEAIADLVHFIENVGALSKNTSAMT
jgi:predicted kinase